MIELAVFNFRGLLFAVSDFLTEWKDNSADLAKIEGAIYYIKTVKVVRRVLIAAFFLFEGFVMLFFAMTMIHLIVLLFLPLPQTWRLVSAILLTVIDISVAGSIFYFFFSQKKWLSFTKSSEMVENVMAHNAVHEEL